MVEISRKEVKIMDKGNPLWLPKGSIRALLAIGLVSAIVYLAVGASAEVPGALTTLAGVVVTYYFKTRETPA